jgi:hypothetical protein
MRPVFISELHIIATQIENKVFRIATYKNMEKLSNICLKNDIQHLEMQMERDWNLMYSWKDRVSKGLETKNQDNLIFR